MENVVLTEDSKLIKTKIQVGILLFMYLIGGIPMPNIFFYPKLHHLNF